MRSSVVLASALAAGALAGPIERRKLVTETRLHIETVTVYVTAGQPLPTSSTDASIKSHSEPTSAAAESTYAPVAPSSSSTSSSSSSSTSSSTSSSLLPAYTPIVIPSTAPSSTSTSSSTSSSLPAYTPIIIPSAVPTTSAIPTTTAAPTTSSQAPPPPPPPSSSAPPAPATPKYGVEHVSGVSQASLSSGEDYKNALLWHHNRARANHGASNLKWSDECESAAKTAANFCDFEHHTVKGQGQNLFTVSGKAFNATAGVTESWYKAEADIYHWWNQEPPRDSKGALEMELFEKYGHLSQMLWKETTHVGCVTIDCGSKMTLGGVSSTLNKYTVCNYAPAGNVVGQFSKNVAPPLTPYTGYGWSD